MQNSSLYEKVIESAPNYPIRLVPQTRSKESIAAHWHEHIEILYFTSGECLFTCGTDSYVARKGDLIFLNSNEIHFTEQRFTSDLWCMHIRPSFFRDTNLENRLINNFIQKDEIVSGIFEQILKEHVRNDAGWDMAVMGYTYVLLAYLLRHHQKNEIRQKNSNQTEVKLQRIEPVIKYISDHYAEKLSTAELADMLFLSEHYFCKLFKSATGQTVTNYINRLRIEKATILLQNTSENLTDIAMLTGFHDLNYFSRTFERVLKMRPGQYRKLLETYKV